MKYIYVFFISMLPLIELRGSLIYSQAIGLPIYISFIVAIFGNILPIPIVFLFARKVLEYGKNKKYLSKLFTLFLEKGHNAGQKLTKKSKFGIYIALLLFVGIPLPGTGAWTGALAASILDMDFKKSMIYIFLGLILAGVIISILSVVGFNLI
ncbi:COG2426 family protein [Caviibacter abscessus]|uniref:COG2426 family protein n=1 Tax=Caviibacter abscessus TaxID=1766719 RepID=UPI00082BF607|nr:small multi-drug export protein [Caviibacter abscessus]